MEQQEKDFTSLLLRKMPKKVNRIIVSRQAKELAKNKRISKEQALYKIVIESETNDFRPIGN
jgi:hypothetical protein